MIDEAISPTFAFFDFDFSEFIDTNFDMSSDIIPSAMTNSSASVVSASSASSSSTTNSHHAFSLECDLIKQGKSELSSPPLNGSLLWSSIEELALKMTPSSKNTLSCLDRFIKEPNSDLVELVQSSDADYSLFKDLIAGSSGSSQLSRTASYSRLPSAKTHQKENSHFDTCSYKSNLFQQKRQVDNRMYEASNLSKILALDDDRMYSPPNGSANDQLMKAIMQQSKKTITNKDLMSQQNKVSYYQIPEANYASTTAPYTYNPSMVSTLSQPTQYYQQRKAPTTISAPRKGVVYHHPYHNRYSLNSNLNHGVGRAIHQKSTMYSSDLTRAQLLEIQAISKAQQDFIRAREQQESGKSMMFKNQLKK